jgi:predicted nucleic-acid-binding protein
VKALDTNVLARFLRLSATRHCPRVLDALDAFERDLDFAGALHLTRSTRASAFVTFDRKLAKRAAGLQLAPPTELLV